VKQITRYRHLVRYRRIANSVVKHGFGHLLAQIGLSKLLPSVRRARKEEPELLSFSRSRRLRLLLEELGPTFVKFGQLISTRPDLLPRDIVEEMSHLQDNVPALPYTEAETILERELKRPLPEIFCHIEPQAHAAASVAQVHRATLHNGEQVVIKIRRPGIVEQMNTDLEILLDMAKLTERHTSWGRVYRVREVILELQRAVREELDFLTEAENADQFRANFNARHDIVIPRIYWDYTTSAVLTMEMMYGTKLNEPAVLAAAGHDPSLIARLLIDATYLQIFRHGLFHADPHPGNLAVSADGRLIFMDFGIVGRIKGERRRQFILFLLGMVSRSSRQIVRSLSDMGMLSHRLDRKALRRDVEHLMDKYLDVPLHKIQLGKAVREIFSLSFEHNIRIPSEFTMLGKTIMTLEGVIEKLDAELKLIELLKPYASRLLRERYSPLSLKETISEQFFEVHDFLISLPRRLSEVFDRFEADGLPVQLSYPDLDKAFNHIDRMGNRITFSIVLLSFSIIMAGLIIGSGLAASVTGELMLWRLPVLEIGFIIAGFMVVWLLLAILRSGRL
jgi:ubiquinone biosynthesis protein